MSKRIDAILDALPIVIGVFPGGGFNHNLDDEARKLHSRFSTSPMGRVSDFMIDSSAHQSGGHCFKQQRARAINVLT